jgi:hypothetical protein
VSDFHLFYTKAQLAMAQGWTLKARTRKRDFGSMPIAECDEHAEVKHLSG